MNPRFVPAGRSRPILAAGLFALLAAGALADGRGASAGARDLAGRTVGLNAGHCPPADPLALGNGDGRGTHSLVRGDFRFPGNALAIKAGPWRGAIRESDLVADIVERVAVRLAARGAGVVRLRVAPAGTNEHLVRRALRARAARAVRGGVELVLDLHANDEGPGRRGFQFLLPSRAARGSDRLVILPLSRAPGTADPWLRRSFELADSLRRELLAMGRPGPAIPPAGTFPFAGTTLQVIGRVTVPAVLCELGCMSDRDDMRLLAESAYRDRLADALCAGIAAWLRANPPAKDRR